MLTRMIVSEFRSGWRFSPDMSHITGVALVWRWGARMLMPAVTILALLALSPALRAGFVLPDDHGILAHAATTIQHPQIPHPMSVVERALTEDSARGRFRPVSVLIRYAQIDVLQDRPWAWHAFTLAVGIAAAWLLYATAGRVLCAVLPAVMVGAWLLLTPGASFTWVRLGPQEIPGTLLFAASAYCAVRAVRASGPAWDVGYVLAAIAAALTKESFALTLPALAAWRVAVWLFAAGACPRKRREALVAAASVALGGVLLSLLIFEVGRRAGASSDGGRFLHLDPASYFGLVLDNAVLLYLAGGWLVLLPGLLFAVAWIRKRCRPREIVGWLVGLVLVLLLVVPQILLYSSTGLMTERYVLPAGLGVAAAAAAGLAWLHRTGRRAVYWIGLLAWAAVLLVDAGISHTDAEYFRADSEQLASMVNSVATSAPIGSTVALAVNPVEHYEQAVSLLYHLAHTGRSDLRIDLLVVPPDHDLSAADAELPHNLIQNLFSGPAAVTPADCPKLGAVILLVSRERASQVLPCINTATPRSVSFRDNVTAMSDLLPLPWPPRTRTEVGYTVLLNDLGAPAH
jgi:hypothetical protein